MSAAGSPSGESTPIRCSGGASCSAVPKPLRSLEAIGDRETVFSRFFKREDEPEWPPGPATPGYLQDYLVNLAVLLPLRAPESLQERKQRYRIFVHVLGKEWDKRAKVAHLEDRETPSPPTAPSLKRCATGAPIPSCWTI